MNTLVLGKGMVMNVKDDYNYNDFIESVGYIFNSRSNTVDYKRYEDVNTGKKYVYILTDDGLKEEKASKRIDTKSILLIVEGEINMIKGNLIIDANEVIFYAAHFDRKLFPEIQEVLKEAKFIEEKNSVRLVQLYDDIERLNKIICCNTEKDRIDAYIDVYKKEYLIGDDSIQSSKLNELKLILKDILDMCQDREEFYTLVNVISKMTCIKEN